MTYTPKIVIIEIVSIWDIGKGKAASTKKETAKLPR